jgi:hypothetical protein
VDGFVAMCSDCNSAREGESECENCWERGVIKAPGHHHQPPTVTPAPQHITPCMRRNAAPGDGCGKRPALGVSGLPCMGCMPFFLGNRPEWILVFCCSQFRSHFIHHYQKNTAYYSVLPKKTFILKPQFFLVSVKELSSVSVVGALSATLGQPGSIPQGSEYQSSFLLLRYKYINKKC